MRNRKLVLTILLSAALLLILAACGNDKEVNYPNAHLLVDVKWLEENINNDNLVIIDARGGTAYEDGHIPGAVRVGSINDSDNEVNGFLLNADSFGELLRNAAGLNQDSTVVVYDGGNALWASRFFYALEYYGFYDQVKVLDGGFPAWLTAGKDVSFEAPEVTPGNFIAVANQNLVTSREDVTSNLGEENFIFLDARSEGEYKGEDVRAARGGHIPGAVHQEWSDVIVENEEGLSVFMTFKDLKASFERIGVVEGKTVVPYCQTNVRGAHTYFALRLLGYSDIRPYEGSWAEWGNIEDTPIGS